MNKMNHTNFSNFKGIDYDLFLLWLILDKKLAVYYCEK